MRDFNFQNESTTDNANIRPLETPPEAAILDETPPEDTSSLRPFHVEQDEDTEESNNLPKIVGAVVVGLLIVGGGLYAYETSFTNRAPVKTVAMNTTAPVKTAATAPLPAANPDMTPPTAAPAPAAPVKSAAQTPAPVERSASNAPAMTPGVGIGPTNDPAINAPMTLTPETAPPPQGSSGQMAEASQPATANSAAASPAQTAMQQPITAPNVGSTSQPTASVAANQASGVTLPSSSSTAAVQPAPTDQATQQPVQIQPAQIQPAPVQ